MSSHMLHLTRTYQRILQTGVVTLGMWLPTAMYAQGLEIIPASWSNDPNCNITTGMMKAACIPILIGHFVVLIFSLLSAFFLINVMYAGYEIAMGSWTGDKANGKNRLTWSIIGLIISVCAYLILNLVVTVILAP